MTVDRGEVHAVLFDLDHTLWERDTAVRRLVTAQHGGFAALAAVPRDEYVERVLMLDDHGHSRQEGDVRTGGSGV